MHIQYASDLHLEFQENNAFIKANPLNPVADILILAGDVLPFSLIDKHADFLNYLSDHFEQTYWIPGNHEYYHYDAFKKCGSFCEKIRSNVSLLNNTTIYTGDAQLIFSTLWSYISPLNRGKIERSMNDFHLITYNGERLTSDHFNMLHAESLQFVEKELSVPATRKVVITHHVPTLLNYPPEYKGTALNDAFAIELFDLIEKTGPEFWIYGHHHTNTPDFTIGKTQLLTNQLGYVSHNEGRLFKSDKTLEI